MSAWGWPPAGVGEVVARRGGRLEGVSGGFGGRDGGDVREEVAG